MIENRYRGPEILYYKQEDLSDLKYIKLIYTDLDNDTHEVKTEINFLGDDFLSLYVGKDTKKQEEETENEENPKEDWEENETQSLNSADYLEKIAKIKELKEQAEITGNFDEYYRKLAELQKPEKKARPQEVQKTKEELEQEEKERIEDEEREAKKYEVDCPQKILLKFVIGELLYIAAAELREVKVKSSKVYFRIKAPEILKLQQKRKFYRINLKRLCLVVATDKKGSSTAFISRSINLSAGGVLINKLESIRDNQYIMLNPNNYIMYDIIVILEMDKVLKLTAKYVRQEEVKKSYRYAFKFVGVGEKKVNFLSKYVISKQIEELRAGYDAKNRPGNEKRKR